MNDTEKHVALASNLPLLDAAYELWLWSKSAARKKDDEHDWKFPARKFDISDPESQKEAFAAAHARVKFEQQSAHLGPAFIGSNERILESTTPRCRMRSARR